MDEVESTMVLREMRGLTTMCVAKEEPAHADLGNDTSAVAGGSL